MMIEFEDRYYEDGSMKPFYKEELRQEKWSELEIYNLEQIHIRRVASDKKVAECQRQHVKHIAEWRRQRQAEIESNKKLGVKPSYVINYINTSSSNQSVFSLTKDSARDSEMAGLNREELLSQGYLDFDELDDY